MTKKKRNIIIAFALAVLLAGSAYFLMAYEKPYIMKLMINYSMSGDTYHFILYKDNTLFCSMVEKGKPPENIKSKLIPWKIRKHQEIKLDTRDFEEIITLAGEVKKSIKHEPTMIVTESWHYTLYYEGHKFETDGIAVTNGALVELCIKIEELSPIEVKLPYISK